MKENDILKTYKKIIINSTYGQMSHGGSHFKFDSVLYDKYLYQLKINDRRRKLKLLIK